MPPDPWKLLRLNELTEEQQRKLKTVLQKRQDALETALKQVEQAMVTLSRSLDEGSQPTYRTKVKNKSKRKSKR